MKTSRDTWLFADIGGTNLRLRHRLPDGSPGASARLPGDAFGSLQEAIDAFQSSAGMRADRAALAVAARLRGEELLLTNRAWRCRVGELRLALGFELLQVVNDFVAAAAGLPSLGPADCTVVRPGAPASRNLLLVGPGTGLGTAALFGAGNGGGGNGAGNSSAGSNGGSSSGMSTGPGAGRGEAVVASEAGHMTLAAPDTELVARLIDEARQRWGRLSWERALSGSGLAWLYASAYGGDASAGAAQVAQRAQAGEPAACATARTFSAWLGAFAGDMCLAFGADGGVYLTGGVLAGLGPAFDRDAFIAAFQAKGRYAQRLADVPVWRVHHGDDLAFRGLARIVTGQTFAPGLRATTEGFDERF